MADLAAVDRMLGYGAETLRRCYQCGTCSVVCPRTPLEDAFPRKEMVWAQWGLEDKLLTNGDAWLCYQCNDCITHCPVDARPGDVMAATRDLQMEEFAVPRFMTRMTRDPQGAAPRHRHPRRARRADGPRRPRPSPAATGSSRRATSSSGTSSERDGSTPSS